MPYNNVIARTDTVIPVEVSREVIKSVAEKTPVLSLARRLKDMSRAQKDMPVMSALATAYFVNGDTGLKQTTEVNWENKHVHAEEIAAIVPISEAVLDDADYDIWSEAKESLVEAFGICIFQAVAYGTNIPANWTNDLGAAGLVAGATAAGQVVSIAGGGFADLYDAIMAESVAGAGDGLLMLLEADGFMASGHIAHTTLRGRLRGLRDANGNPIFTRAMQDKTRYELDGEPIYFPTDGSVVAANSLDIAGDWSQLVYAMRQDMTYKILTEAVIQDAAGNIVYNLAQQDMVALRAVMRLGFALPNPIKRMNTNAATRFPFSVLTA